MEKTLVILKPSSVQRRLIGEIISRFEKKGLLLVGMKMMWLNDEILTEHYAHLKDKPFFHRVKNSMETCPVIVTCWEGIEAAAVIRSISGTTNGRTAQPGTIRGDFSVSVQENIIHTSDSAENAAIELNRFFKPDEIFNYNSLLLSNLYSNDEI